MFDPALVGFGNGSGGRNSLASTGKEYFPDPWCDYAALEMPRNLESVLQWAEFIWLSNGTYRMACERVNRYFITNFEFADVSDEEGEKYRDYLENSMQITTNLATVGNDFMCFHGDTDVVTDIGIYKIRDLSGKVVNVLSKDGIYRSAIFKEYGEQELLEVEFSDSRTVLATPEHQWEVLKSTGGSVRVATTELAGRRIARTVASRPDKGAEYKEGVRHGFIFGDGSVYNKDRKTPKSVANFFDTKDKALLKYFDDEDKNIKSYQDGRLLKIHGFPAQYKQLPKNEASAEYWYGFVCGFLAADGSVDTYGCALLTQASKSTLEVITKQLPRIGMVAGPIRGYSTVSEFRREDGSVDSYPTEIYCVTLLKQFMLVDDFIIDSHIEKFVRNNRDTNYGKYIGVKSVKQTGIFDKVYCCVEDITHTFVIDNGILTGNCYGNSFTSVFVPFDRFLKCPKCSFERPLKNVEFKFTREFEFSGTCPACKSKVNFKRRDRRADDDDLRIIRWPPREMIIQYNPISHSVEYRWRIPAHIKDEVRKGNPFYLASTPWEIIQTIKEDKLFHFVEDAVYHMKEETLAGIQVYGWGIPRMISNFKQAYYIQVLKRYNEALALDYIVPFRVLTPAPGSSREGDPLLQQNLGMHKGMVMDMLSQRRKDPALWNYLPFPIQYQALGGEGMQMATYELIDKATDEMLNAQGIPSELYRGTIQVQAAPTALRLFQQTWCQLVSSYNGWLGWVVRQLAHLKNWEPVSIKLQPVTLADDMEKKQVLLQLAGANQVSKQTAFGAFGINVKDEIRKLLEEEQYMEDQTRAKEREAMERQKMDEALANLEQQQQQAAQGGMPPPAGGAPGMPPGGGAPMGGAPGMPPGGGGGSPADMVANAGQPGMPPKPQTPQEMMAQAEQIAQQLLQMPYEQRKSELLRIKKADEAMHAFITSKMESIRQKTNSQAGYQAIQSGSFAAAQ